MAWEGRGGKGWRFQPRPSVRGATGRVAERASLGLAVAQLKNGEVAEGAGEGEGAVDKPRAEVIRIAVGDIQAGELEKNLLLQPNDTVFVPQAPKVFVSGEVKSPGAYGWFPGMTARQLISMAGGLTPDGSDGRLKVVRQVGGASEEDKIKLDDPVKPGDTIVVRRRLF